MFVTSVASSLLPHHPGKRYQFRKTVHSHYFMSQFFLARSERPVCSSTVLPPVRSPPAAGPRGGSSARHCHVAQEFGLGLWKGNVYLIPVNGLRGGGLAISAAAALKSQLNTVTQQEVLEPSTPRCSSDLTAPPPSGKYLSMLSGCQGSEVRFLGRTLKNLCSS